MSESRGQVSNDTAVAATADGTHGAVAPSPLALLRAWIGSDWKWLVPGGGGLLLLLHFWRIGFLPSLSFADLSAVLGAFVLFFVAGVIAFSGLLLLPVLVIAMWVRASIFLPPPRKRRSRDEGAVGGDARRKSLRSPVSARSRDALSAAHRRVLGWSLRPGTLPSFLTASAVAIAIYVALVQTGFYWKLTWTTRCFGLLFAVSSALMVFMVFFGDTDWLRARLLQWRRPIVQWLLLFVMYLAVWPFLLILFTKVDGFGSTGTWFWIAAIALPLMVPIAHWLWYVSLRLPAQRVMIPRIVFVIVVMVYSGLPVLLVDATVNTLGLGMMKHVDLVLTTRGCDFVHAGWPERVCTPDHREGVEMGTLDDVEVLTRIGSQYYIAPPGGIADPKLPRIAIPSSEVVGFVRK